ncbi:MAG: nucleotidyl transferase AbiEii/AbiGii toxin family protein [Candidatus Protochlamydia sp.]|nr:nucleotidyl transferase AbiEii/AbiGii toxin family protein [Candidatus Protochlamydia sp.]
MNPALEVMLRRYHCETRPQYERALKEILQELALVGLWRGRFFEHAAFYGGTALRILYGLDRFSEDLDFTLFFPDPHFSLEPYHNAIRNELISYGFSVEIDVKDKSWATPIRSAFIKTNTLGELFKIGIPKNLVRGLHPEMLLKIKLEVDTDPPPAYSAETRFLLTPFNLGIRTVALPDIFSGKMHAVLFREWRGRVKGRDWYDWAWLVAQNVVLPLQRLAIHMRQAGTLKNNEILTKERFEELVLTKIEQVDFTSAKADMQPFVTNSAQIADWSPDLFRHLLKQTKTSD